VLIEEAASHPAVTVRFEQTCIGIHPGKDTLRLRSQTSGMDYEVGLTATLATDGAGSAVRGSLAAQGRVEVREDWLDHGYKELSLPPLAAGATPLDPHALHVWPRGGFMLIALPNTDGSFTATLFLAHAGAPSFAALTDPEAVQRFFRQEFPDIGPLIPELSSQFSAHPTGHMATVHASPWSIGDQVLLLGDAAHAIVPFHGQGMNAAFEDCAVLDSLLDRRDDRHDNWGEMYQQFETLRRPDTQAIAHMALENYTEMRATVLDTAFVRQKAIALELERRFPDRFIPRYAMVMFHPEIRYSEALRRGAIQARILLELDPGPGARDDGDVAGRTDFALATRLVSERLPALLTVGQA
jgi:kynurenine 3-monooxygenase